MEQNKEKKDLPMPRYKIQDMTKEELKEFNYKVKIGVMYVRRKLHSRQEDDTDKNKKKR